MDASKQLEIKQVSIQKLKELPGNPRYWSEKATKDLTESLTKFSVVEPLVVNYDNTVLGGNFRLSVLRKLGHKSVPCSCQNAIDGVPGVGIPKDPMAWSIAKGS